MKVSIIGMGEIGSGLYEEMQKKGIDEITGVEISEKRIEELKKNGFNVTGKVPLDSDVYIIAVLLSGQVMDVIASNTLPEKSLVVVESTLSPGTAKCIMTLKPHTKLVVFPHRYDPDTVKKHGFLNLNNEFARVIGTVDKETEKEALDFYSRYLDTNFLHFTSIDAAEMSKTLENAYRYIEIAIAEELKTLMEKRGIDFEEVRKAINSKWNTDIKEAKNGIGRHCLPKDIKIMDWFFPENTFFKGAMAAEEKYRQNLIEHGIVPDKVTGRSDSDSSVLASQGALCRPVLMQAHSPGKASVSKKDGWQNS